MLSLLKFRKLNTNEKKIFDQFTFAFVKNSNFIVGLTFECL